MSFLTIGGRAIPVAVDGATKKSPEQGGSDSRTYNGDLRSTLRWEKRQWQFTTKMLLEADAAAIEADNVGGPFQTCGGDALGSATPTCRVTLGDGPFKTVRGGSRRALVITLREV